MYKAASDAVYDAFVDAETGRVLQAQRTWSSRPANARVWEQLPGRAAGRHRATEGPRSARVPRRPARRRSTGRTSLDVLGPRRRRRARRRRGDRTHRRHVPVRVHPAHERERRLQRRRSRARGTRPPSAELGGEPQPERRPGLLLRQPVPRPPRRAADQLHGRQLRGRRRARRPAHRRRRGLERPGRRQPHRNNANMFTPPDGSSPLMQMYLWGQDGRVPRRQRRRRRGDRLPRVHARPLEPARQGRGRRGRAELGPGRRDGRGLERLVRDGLPGREQLPAPTPAPSGDVVMGTYTDVTPNSIRTQPLDCPVGASSAACPGTGTAGTGGYTYGDFGKIFGGARGARRRRDLGRDAVGPADASIGSRRRPAG